MMFRDVVSIVVGLALAGSGLYLVYGAFTVGSLGDTGLQIRDVTLSPGIVLTGGGLFLVINRIRKMLTR
jgi:hypothetical protein